jgi:hypothetical protein
MKFVKGDFTLDEFEDIVDKMHRAGEITTKR